MGLFFSFSVGVMSVQADPPGNATCNAQCIALGDLGLSHGQCVSFCATCTNNGNTDAVCFCNFADFIGYLDYAGLSFGDCVSTFN